MNLKEFRLFLPEETDASAHTYMIYLPSRPKDVGNLQLYIMTISGNIYFMPQVRRAGGADLARREGASYIHNQDVEGFEDKTAIKERNLPTAEPGRRAMNNKWF